MATLTVRNVDEDVKSKLRQIAAKNGHSMEEEMRRILARSIEQESEKGLGSKIVELFQEIGGVDLEIPPRIVRENDEITFTDGKKTLFKLVPITNKLGVEEAFADVYGQIEFLDEPDAPTIDEWVDA